MEAVMKSIYWFNTENIPEIEEVGGKALSLIRLTGGGFAVPFGAVLGVSFFEPWIKELKRQEDLAARFEKAEDYATLSRELKNLAATLSFNQVQTVILKSVLDGMADTALFAVRSSAPEEDLSGASFAGGYETVLGVLPENVQEAVKTAFASCLDERVFFYKRQQGFDPGNLRIAVVIQAQLNSRASGVGFSLNPLNNDYDQLVINANTGLGESVVSGLVTPDEWVLDKWSLELLEERQGSKEKIIELLATGGTQTLDISLRRWALKEDEVNAVGGLIRKVEEYYGHFVDIEWAFQGDELYLLQARPVTAYVPLPQEMQTAPGERRNLYLDGSLIKQGINSPISVLGCDCIGFTQSQMFTNMMGKDTSEDVMNGMATTRGGRMYMNLSTTLKFQGEKRVIQMWDSVDLNTAQMIRTLDMAEYVPKRLPSAMKGVLWGTVKNNAGAIFKMLKASKDPAGYKSWYVPFEEEFDGYLQEVSYKKQDLVPVMMEIVDRYLGLLDKMLPMTYAAEYARSSISKQLRKAFDDGQEKMQYLERSLPDNVTIDMGLSMYNLSQYPEIKDRDYLGFKKMLDSWQISAGFLSDWQKHLDVYGCRTNNELDVGVRRIEEKVPELFAQIKAMSGIEKSFSPLSIYEESRKLREEIYQELEGKLSGRAKKKLEKNYRILVEMGGKRESLKYWYVRSLSAIRTRILEEATEMQKAGYLEDVEDVFWLSLPTVTAWRDKSKEELAEERMEHESYYQLLYNVAAFPQLIDSRGRILTLPRQEAKEGEISGQPISPGVVRGRVKVLHAPDEKPLLPGEILVARATDPGWTPLFINASAILLEVGGLLQHGALVAREYGKPCIAGIDKVTERLTDGQLVEVDAAAGIIRTEIEE
jgi:pyruvate,water dikinase